MYFVFVLIEAAQQLELETQLRIIVPVSVESWSRSVSCKLCVYNCPAHVSSTAHVSHVRTVVSERVSVRE